MKVLAALIVNKVLAFGTAGCTNDDVLHFVTVQGQAKQGRYQTEIETPAHVLYAEPSNNRGACTGLHNGDEERDKRILRILTIYLCNT